MASVKGFISMLKCYEDVGEHRDKACPVDKDKKRKVQSRNISCHGVERKALLQTEIW